MSFRIAQAEATIERAHAAYREGIAALLRPDRTRRYSDTEHAEREVALREERDAAVRGAAAIAVAAGAEARDALARLIPADPMTLLSPSDMEKANGLALFIREDCEALPLAELAARLDAAQGQVAKVLHWRYAERRLAAEPDMATPSGLTFSPPGVHALRESLERLRGSFVDANRVADLEQQITDAGRVTGRVATDRYLAAEYGPRG